MANKNQYTAQQFIDAIPGTGGIVSAIARKIPCDWHTAKRYIDKYPTVKDAYDDECESVLDASESVVYGNVQAAQKAQRESNYTVQVDSSDAKWLLSRKGKHRGYAERQEITGADGESILIQVDR